MTAEVSDRRPGPLAGVRVLDLTSVVFGAYATQILGDQGADVIKVEDPGAGRGSGGDIMRWAGHTPDGCPRELGPIFLTINRNKRSVLLDLGDPEMRPALERLVASCDVFVASVRYQGLTRLGLDYEAVRRLRPDVIYAHAAGYGSEGPYAGEPAYDDLIQSASGFADLLGRVDGNPTPRLLPSLIADKVSGLFMAQAITAAILHREKTGEGQFVEVPMMECVTSFNLVEHLADQAFDPPTGPWTYSRVTTRDRRPFETLDGHIGLLPYTDKQWDLFFEAAGLTESMASDPRFSTYAARTRNGAALFDQVEAVTRTRTTAEWLALLKPLHIPVTQTNRMEDLPGDPHLLAVGLFETRQHPHAGAYRSIRPPVRFSASPACVRRDAPLLGEHTAEVLAEVAEHSAEA